MQTAELTFKSRIPAVGPNRTRWVDPRLIDDVRSYQRSKTTYVFESPDAKVEEETVPWSNAREDFYHLNYVNALPDDEVIRNAEDGVGKSDYRLLDWNCETFAAFCKTGQTRGLNKQGDVAKFALGIANRGLTEFARRSRNMQSMHNHK